MRNGNLQPNVAIRIHRSNTVARSMSAASQNGKRINSIKALEYRYEQVMHSYYMAEAQVSA
jgi:hypothetical protein